MKKYFLVASMALTVIFSACNSSSTKTGNEAKTSENSEMTMPNDNKGEHAMLGVKGNCEMCKEKIETSAKNVNGVTSAVWDMDAKELHLNFDPQKTSVTEVSKVITKAGYETDIDKADQTAYEALPSCCKYKDEHAEHKH